MRDDPATKRAIRKRMDQLGMDTFTELTEAAGIKRLATISELVNETAQPSERPGHRGQVTGEIPDDLELHVQLHTDAGVVVVMDPGRLQSALGSSHG